MKSISVSEGKRDFTALIAMSEKGESILVHKRKKPLAVIVPLEEYNRLKKLQSYLKMIEISTELEGSGPSISEILYESREMLEAPDEDDN